jgi:hypothetical protein
MLVDSTSAHLHGGSSVDPTNTPELLHTDAPEKVLIGTVAAIPLGGLAGYQPCDRIRLLNAFRLDHSTLSDGSQWNVGGGEGEAGSPVC